MSSVEVDAKGQAARDTGAVALHNCGPSPERACSRRRQRRPCLRSAHGWTKNASIPLQVLLALFALCCLPAHAAVPIHIKVATPVGVLAAGTTGDLTAHVRLRGVEHRLALTRDHQGMWSGAIEAPQSRSLAVELWRHDGPRPVRLYQGLEVLPVGATTLHWALGGPEPQAAWRLSESKQPEDIADAEELGAIWTSLWLVASCLIVLILGRRALGQPERDQVRSNLCNGWTDTLVWIGLGLLWTWPAALAGQAGIVGRHFDALGTVWVIDAASRLGMDLHDSLSAWPTGATYSAIDSWLLLPLAHLVTSIDPARVHGWLSIIGVSTSGLAATWLARTVGAGRPWHHLAGILFAGSGLMATGLLEGHVYQLINPWLPLMALFLWRATSETGQTRHGIGAGVFFGLSLFTSGYLGISAALLALSVVTPSLSDRRRWGPLSMAALGAFFFGAVYLWLFQSAGAPTTDYASAASLQIGSLSLENIGPHTLEVDRTGHSLALALSGAATALAVVGWRLGAPRASMLLVTAVLGTLLAMGPQWATGIHPDNWVFPSPIAWFWQLEWVQYFRFPSRVMWTPLLCIGVLAALGLTRLTSRLGPWPGWLLMALFVAETIAFVGTPFRQQMRSTTVPAAYMDTDGPVLDLIGEGINANGEVDAWLTAMLCQSQTQHQRPIADDCVAVEASANPRAVLNRWLAARLYAGDTGAVNRRLSRMEFTEVALHTDWLMPSDGVRLRAALQDLSPHNPPRTSDGVVFFTVGDAPDGATPEGPAQRITGPTSSASDTFDWRMRLYLVTGLEHPRARYMVHIVDTDGAEHRAEISNRGSSPEDKIDDGLYTADWQGTVTSGQPVLLTLFRLDESQNVQLWSGPVMPIDLDEDQINFRFAEDGSAEPMLRAVDSFAPEVRNRRGQIIGLGWLGVFSLIGLWVVRHRRRVTA